MFCGNESIFIIMDSPAAGCLFGLSSNHVFYLSTNILYCKQLHISLVTHISEQLEDN